MCIKFRLVILTAFLIPIRSFGEVFSFGYSEKYVTVDEKCEAYPVATYLEWAKQVIEKARAHDCDPEGENRVVCDKHRIIPVADVDVAAMTKSECETQRLAKKREYEEKWKRWGKSASPPKGCRELSFEVARKLGEHQYEIQVLVGGLPPSCIGRISDRGCSKYSRAKEIYETALLETTQTEFVGAGRAGSWVVSSGTRSHKDAKGFTKKVTVFKESPACFPKNKEPQYGRFAWGFREATGQCGKVQARVDDPDSRPIGHPRTYLRVDGDRLFIKDEFRENFYYTSKEACENDKERDL